MANKKKYYVVWRGLKPGIYERWLDCADQVRGFQGAIYAGFPTLEEAKKAFLTEPKNYYQKKREKQQDVYGATSVNGPITISLSVDAACSGNPGEMEYRGVFTDTRSLIFKQGPFKQGTNNIGEFLAIVHALAWLKKNKLEMPVYSDSTNAISWVIKRNAKTKLERSEINADVFELIDRAVNWLNNNTYTNQILKWDTANWGEIPADFGRK